MRTFLSVGIRTRFSGYDLTNIMIGSAMDVRIEGGETRNGDVLGKQVEFRDPVPDLRLWREL